MHELLPIPLPQGIRYSRRRNADFFCVRHKAIETFFIGEKPNGNYLHSLLVNNYYKITVLYKLRNLARYLLYVQR